MTTTIYKLEWKFGSQWSRLFGDWPSLEGIRLHARTVFLPPTKADAKPPMRIIKITTTEAVVEDVPDPESPPPCIHQPRGCCVHDLEVAAYASDGPCTPDCFRRRNRCSNNIQPGAAGVAVRPGRCLP